MLYQSLVTPLSAAVSDLVSLANELTSGAYLMVIALANIIFFFHPCGQSTGDGVDFTVLLRPA